MVFSGFYSPAPLELTFLGGMDRIPLAIIVFIDGQSGDRGLIMDTITEAYENDIQMIDGTCSCTS